MTMYEVKSASLALCLGTNMVLALPCDGFQLDVKNDLPNTLWVKDIRLDDAVIAPGDLQKLEKKTEQAFTVNDSTETLMVGQFSFHTTNGSNNKVIVQYTLENTALTCKFTEIWLESDYNFHTVHLPGHVTFTISNF